MKKFIYLLFILIQSSTSVLAFYDMSTPVEGSSIANDELQFNVIKAIYKSISVKTATCSDYSISNTQLLHYPYEAKKDKYGNYIKGYWKELWTVDTCGQKQQIPVTFIIKKKTTKFQIDNFFIQ